MAGMGNQNLCHNFHVHKPHNQFCLQLFVFFPEDLKVGVKIIKTYAERMRSEGVGRAIMVTIANITPFARQCLQEMHSKYYIETVST